MRSPLNVEGKYYVDTTCVHCKLCHEVAPDHFSQTEDGEGFVHKQPSTLIEEDLCQKAKESCPVSAIHSESQF